MPWDAVFFHPQSSHSPRVSVSLTEGTLDIRDQDNLVVASWAFETLFCHEIPVAGQPLILGCSESAQSRLSILDLTFRTALLEVAPQVFGRGPHADRRWTPPGSRRSFTLWPSARRPTWSRGCLVGVIVGLCLLAAGGWWVWHTVSVLLSPNRLLHYAITAPLPPACSGNAGQRALDQLTERLAIAAQLSPYPFVTVIDDELPQIFSTPGRGIVLTRPLLEALENSDELAALLAHEIGHIAQKTLPSILSSTGDSDHRPWHHLAVSCLSESDELEADAWALRSLQAVGVDPGVLRHTLERLPLSEGSSAESVWRGMACTHPVSPERLAALPELEQSEDTPPPREPTEPSPWGGATPPPTPSVISAKQWHAIQKICTP